MCKCPLTTKVQDYSNQTVLFYPHWFISQKRHRAAGIDNCILDEIKDLWASGIQTDESCCGHNDQAPPYISVPDEYIPRMRALGYKNYEPFPGDVYDAGWLMLFRPDIFIPKTPGLHIISFDLSFNIE